MPQWAQQAHLIYTVSCLPVPSPLQTSFLSEGAVVGTALMSSSAAPSEAASVVFIRPGVPRPLACSLPGNALSCQHMHGITTGTHYIGEAGVKSRRRALPASQAARWAAIPSTWAQHSEGTFLGLCGGRSASMHMSAHLSPPHPSGDLARAGTAHGVCSRVCVIGVLSVVCGLRSACGCQVARVARG